MFTSLDNLFALDSLFAFFGGHRSVGGPMPKILQKLNFVLSLLLCLGIHAVDSLPQANDYAIPITNVEVLENGAFKLSFSHKPWGKNPQTVVLTDDDGMATLAAVQKAVITQLGYDALKDPSSLLSQYISPSSGAVSIQKAALDRAISVLKTASGNAKLEGTDLTANDALRIALNTRKLFDSGAWDVAKTKELGEFIGQLAPGGGPYSVSIYGVDGIKGPVQRKGKLGDLNILDGNLRGPYFRKTGQGRSKSEVSIFANFSQLERIGKAYWEDGTHSTLGHTTGARSGR